MKMREPPQTKQVTHDAPRGRRWGEGRWANLRGSEHSIHLSFYTTLTLYKNGYSHARRNGTHGIRKQTLFVVI